MAHADYDCCAICDSKQSYNSDSRTKEEICSDCLHALRDAGINALDTDEFIRWVNGQSAELLEPKLNEIRFNICRYGNAVDEAVKTKLPHFQSPEVYK